MARLYADENVVSAIVARLQSLGHDAITVLEDGRANRQTPDLEVLQRAIELGRCVITNNRHHFHRLHASTPAHHGILTFTTDLQYDRLADRIHEAIASADSLENRLIKVVRPNPPTASPR